MIEEHRHTDWPKPVIALAGFSGSGKTTLLCKLLDQLTSQGFNVAVIKHSHHQVELDQPGKDSYRLTHSGASQLLLSCPNQAILFHAQTQHDDINSQLRLLDWKSLDLVIVEGYRHSNIAKLEVHRPELGKPLLCLDDPDIFALACNQPMEQVTCPVWPLNAPDKIAQLLINYCFGDTLTHDHGD
ncbi:molybdopterin-guanine dinucleotide biosynthesis protein B [Celerinatantimonas yamalensis]|uniref:Molybdopterin-guanine dinucleotide biosynthesis protein B n=1 Tax=Celerinatantimonas yamalensis TaxID=559956 RepID=A0ABW9G5D4_9GAMM